MPPLPIQLIRGERRQIEEEIANRILSDISEENSIAGSMLSADDFADLQRLRQDDVTCFDAREFKYSNKFNYYPFKLDGFILLSFFSFLILHLIFSRS